MTAEGALEGLQRFLLEHVENYEELELVLLLRKRRERDWTPEESSVELGLSPPACAAALKRLNLRGLLANGGTLGSFRYAPCSLELAVSVEYLERFYREQRLSVVRIMSTNAVLRLRSAAVQRFAQIFRTRGPKQ